MPNKAHAIKKQRVDVKRHSVNRTRLSRMRTIVKKVEEQIAAGKQKEAMVALRAAAAVLQRGAQKGLIKKGNASRRISRLNKRIKTMGKKAA
ncbi:MAG: 30S ribosomal protein S20 [Hydrotalea sp.]|nr:30S ribosomal protein S20 [Hydrotalea sp.]